MSGQIQPDAGPDDRPPALILGGGLIALGIVRSMGHRSIPVTVLEWDPADIVRHSRFARWIQLPNPGDDESAVLALISEAACSPRRPVLFVCGDVALRIACANQDRLSDFMDFVLPSESAAFSVLEKTAFAVFAERNSVPVPRTWRPASASELSALLPQLPGDLVIKPRNSTDWHGAVFRAERGYAKLVRVSDQATLMDEWTRLASLAPPPIVQEYIDGDDEDHYSYVSYIDRSGKELVGCCVRKWRLLPIRYGLSTFASIVHDDELADMGRDILRKLEYRGASSVCFKRNPATGRATIFEINGRLPLVHQSLLLAGVDLPWLMYLDANASYGGGTVLKLPAKGRWITLSYDVGAFLGYRATGVLSSARWMRSLLSVRTMVEFDARDLGPFLACLIRLTTLALKGFRMSIAGWARAFGV